MFLMMGYFLTIFYKLKNKDLVSNMGRGSNKNYTLEDGYSLEKQLLSYSGMYPTSNKTFSYYLRATFTWTISCTQLLSQLIMVVLDAGDLSKIISALYFCMTQISFICKLINFTYHNHLLLQLEEELKNPIFNNLPDRKSREYVQGSMANLKRVAALFRILCVGVVCFYALFPIMDNNPESPLPLPGWYPLDTVKYRNEIYVFQVLSIAVSAYNNSSIDVLTSGLMTCATIQFYVLKNRLQSVIGNGANTRLKECVRHHNDILMFVSHVEEMFSNGIFVQFLASVVVISLTGFQMLIIPPTNVMFLLLLVYFSCMMCQVVMYCWYGHGIIIQSSGVGEACYMSNWYKHGLKVNRTIFLIMERSKRPVKLTAGKFFTLSLTTLTMILRSSYSYFAVLQRLYKDKSWF